MREWSLLLTKEAERDFQKLNQGGRDRIFQKLEWLCENFDVITPLPLTGPWQGFFKLRAGDWRIIYRADYVDLTLTVYAIGRRDKIYETRQN